MGHIYIPDRAAQARFRSWSGPVGNDLDRRLKTLRFRAMGSVGVDSGLLRSTIEIRRKTVADGLQGEVGNFHSDYAAAHHEGALPHVIEARRAPRLVFRVNGQLVFAKKVNHPGNKPNPYLSRWLGEAVR